MMLVDFYKELLDQLHLDIIQKYGSVQKFCQENKVSRQNLSAVFQGHQDISVGLYTKIVTSLKGVGGVPTQEKCAVSLRYYLGVNHDFVVSSVLSVICGKVQ